jgi:hypothetical protein
MKFLGAEGAAKVTRGVAFENLLTANFLWAIPRWSRDSCR